MKQNMKTAPDEGRADFPRLELKKDETARVNLFSTADLEVTVRHFVKGVGYVHCHAIEGAKDAVDLLKIEENGGDPDKCPMCRKAMEDADKSREDSLVSSPMRRFAGRLLRYQTDFNGRVIPGPLRAWMLIWVIDNYKFRQLKQLDSEWGDLRQHDMTLNCADPQYQKMTINLVKDALWLKPENKDAIVAYLKMEIPKYNLTDCLAQSLTADVLTRKLENARRRAGASASPAGRPVELGAPGARVESSTGSASLDDDDVFGKTGAGSPGAFSDADLGVTEKGKTPEVEPVDILKELDLGDLK